MAAPSQYEDRQMQIGRVFARAFGTIGANPLSVFGIAFLFGALPGALVSLATQALTATGFTLGFALAGIVAALASITFSMMTQGALVRITVAHAQEGRATPGEALWAGLRVVVPLFFLGLLLTLGVAFGFLLLVVPAVILYVMWSVAAPALVEERCGVFAAFGRSRALTKGARWKIFALELVVLIFYWLIAAVIGVGAIFAGHLFNQGVVILPWSIALGALSTTLTAAVWGTIQTSLYVELRYWKDGPVRERLADIFA
jgi:hypothetical protein